MATVTPNYSWPVPTSTDLVKDGATAIEALGDAIDATVFALPSPGLTLINTTSFSGVSSQSVNSVFSATYDNYLIMINYDSISGADSNFWIKLRASGTDSSTTYANWIMGVTSANAANNIVNNSATSAIINQSDSTETGPKTTSLFLFSPFKAQHTFGHLQSTGISQSGQYIALAGSIAHLTATSYDGFTLSRTGGTFTGSVSVYGVNK
jgi:hypothetical protein